MTCAEVRRILGGPDTVDRREELSRGRRYLEWFKRYQVVAVRVHQQRGDYCFRGSHVCTPLP